ncbi:MAG TPA: hypothetical protein VF426_12805 [Marmoricola sp.]
MEAAIGPETRILLLCAGIVFTWALALGVQKYVQIIRSADGSAHTYTDIAHRAALLYSFALVLIAAFAELSDWPWQVDLAAGLVEVFFFASAIGSYQWHGLRKDTENQMHPATPSMRLFMAALIVGEIGGFLVLLAGFLHAWWS